MRRPIAIRRNSYECMHGGWQKFPGLAAISFSVANGLGRGYTWLDGWGNENGVRVLYLFVRDL